MERVEARSVPEYVRASAADRTAAAITAAIALAVLCVAAWLSPSSDGHGTHTQLGLPACGMYLVTGQPCPTCGMTTSFALMTKLRVVEAVKTQPFGALLALLTGVWFWGALHVAVFGSRLGSVVMRMLTARTMWATAGLALCAWGYKVWMMNAH